MNQAKTLPKRLGAAIRQLRLEKGWTQEELAKRAVVSRSRLSCIENGKDNPTMSTIISIIAALDYRLEVHIKTGVEIVR